MIQDVYIVEASSIIAESSLTRLLSPLTGFRWIRSTWETLPFDQLADNRSLLVAVGVPDPAIAIQGLRRLSRTAVQVLTLVVVPMDAPSELVQSCRFVADDVIFWPATEQEIQQRLKWLLTPAVRQAESVQRKLTREFALQSVIGTAPSFIRLREQIAHFAPTEAPVLVTGETGTGKELCARAIHTLSPRQHGPFIPVDCGAVPEHLAESELFGHIRGAFTDAHRDHKGLASLAEGGTFFLDEIDALSLTTQGKLLRFIQESTYRPLGGERFIRANVRVIAASNCDLERLVAMKQFRSDLYFRLNVLRLALPPLREHRSDVPLLAQHFLEQLTQRECRSVNLLHPASLQKLESYDWPGNVRELLNVLQRAVVLAAGAPILPKHILFTTTPSPDDESCVTSFRVARSRVIENFERRYIGEMLQKHHGNITHAAREAGQDRRGFGRLAKKYHLEV